MSSLPSSSTSTPALTTGGPTINVLNGGSSVTSVAGSSNGIVSTASTSSATASSSSASAASASASAASNQALVLNKQRLQELVKEVDPLEQLDEDVENLLLHLADDFIEQTVTQASTLAKHRKANAIDVKDVQVVLERNWNMWVPGFGGEELRTHKRSALNEAHKSRMALIRKQLKKY